MKSITWIFATSLVVGCAGKKKEPVQPVPEPQPTAEAEGQKPADPPTTPPAPTPEPTPPPPPAPTVFKAKADMAPVKGVKIKPQTITLQQEQGKGSTVTGGWFEGLKKAKYHFVVHEKGDCAANATKVGPAFAGAGESKVTMDASKDQTNIDHSGLSWPLEGDTSVVGKALVLHEDKKGKPGKAVACGVIAKDDAAAAATP